MSLGKVVMYLHNEAPSATGNSATFAATGGSGWDTGESYYFLVAAWYSASEENINNVGHYNTGFANTLLWPNVGALDAESRAPWAAGSPSAATDTLTITWTEPTHETPHHYAVYMSLAGPSTTTLWTKVNTADIPPGTTTYDVLSPTDRGTAANLYIQAVNTSSKTITVSGNHLISLGAGTSVTTGGAAGTVTSVELLYNARGVNTKITFGAALPGGAAAGGTLAYKIGTCVFYQAYPRWGTLDNVILQPVIQFSPITRNRRYMSFKGNVKRSSSNYDSDIASIVITIGTTGTQNYNDWAGILTGWLHANATIWLIDMNDDPSDQVYGTFAQYIGKIDSLDYYGSLGKNSSPTFTITFAVERQDPQGPGLSWGVP